MLMFIVLLHINMHANGLLKQNRVQGTRFSYVKFRGAQVLMKFPAFIKYQGSQLCAS